MFFRMFVTSYFLIPIIFSQKDSDVTVSQEQLKTSDEKLNRKKWVCGKRLGPPSANQVPKNYNSFPPRFIPLDIIKFEHFNIRNTRSNNCSGTKFYGYGSLQAPIHRKLPSFSVLLLTAYTIPLLSLLLDKDYLA